MQNIKPKEKTGTFLAHSVHCFFWPSVCCLIQINTTNTHVMAAELSVCVILAHCLRIIVSAQLVV